MSGIPQDRTYYDSLIAKRDAVLSTARVSNAARARAMGVRYEYVEPMASPIKSDAAPDGRVDVGLNSDVPPSTNPQADEAATLPATPAPDGGVGTGTQQVIEAVSAAFGVPIIDLVSPSAATRIGAPRWAAALLLRYRLKMDWSRIAVALGYNSRRGVQSALVHARGRLRTDEEWTRQYKAADRAMAK